MWSVRGRVRVAPCWVGVERPALLADLVDGRGSEWWELDGGWPGVAISEAGGARQPGDGEKGRLK
jgi:hypothetical protein